MKPWLCHLPDDESLASGLASVLSGDGSAARVAVIDRLRNPYASTFPSEVVICRLADRSELRLFCKYGTSRDNRAHGHRGGVAFEAEVYRRVLEPAGVVVPPFFGAVTASPNGQVWLLLGYLDSSVRLRDSHHISYWQSAATWCGRFHATFESRATSFSFLNIYDAAYYAGWARRTAEYAGALHGDFPWLADLCRRSEAALAALLDVPCTVIHGEYYSKNLLVNDGMVYPVDWESAALAPGEIDLATLTDGCEPQLVARCELAYSRARWPQGAPPSFARAVDLARLYLHLRWLGDEPGRKLRRRCWRYEELRAVGERLALL